MGSGSFFSSYDANPTVEYSVEVEQKLMVLPQPCSPNLFQTMPWLMAKASQDWKVGRQ